MQNFSPLEWNTPGGAVRLFPTRGRVQNVQVDGHDAMWNPTEASDAWNLGGERLWFGPEADWFWLKPDTYETEFYQVPPGLNPDEWRLLDQSETFCNVELDVDLACPYSEKRAAVRIQRRFDLLPECTLAENAHGVAFLTTTHMTVRDGTPGQPVDFWSILQLPVGGTLLVPTNGMPSPRDYFDPCPAAEIRCEPGLFRLHIGGKTAFKLGLPPGQSIGRMAYTRPVSGGVLILEKSFPVFPSMRYCDSPLHALGSQGDAAQFYNDGGTLGSFGEMEHRSPAIVCGYGPQIRTETALTRAAILSEADYATWLAGFAPPRAA